MKKLLALGLSLAMILSLAACGPTPAETTPEPTTPAPTTTQAPTTEAPTTTEEPTTEAVPEVKIFSYEEFLAAEIDSEVTVESYVQFSAYNAEYGNTSLFLADEEGAYFVYRMNVTPEEAAKLTEGTKIRVTGFKTEWSGEVEFAEGSATFEVVEGDTYTAEPADVTALFGTEDLIGYMNRRVSVAGAIVLPSTDADGSERPFLYKWNGSGADGDDLYFNVSLGGESYTLTVESDECGAGTDVYEAVKALQIGQVIELEGFLYWYEGPQPHIHKVSDMAAKSEGVLSYAEFDAAELDTSIVIEGWIQLAAYNAENGNISLYLQDPDGAYYVWRMNVTPEEAAQLTKGTKVQISGIKTAWAGLIEIADAKFTVLEGGSYLSGVKDITELLGREDELAALMSAHVSLNGMTVVASKDADDNELPFLYKYNGSGQDGDDIYFTVAKGDGRYVLVVETDEFPADSELYAAVKALQIGDVIDAEAFLYWYEGPQPHICAIAASELPADVTMTYEQFMEAEYESEVIISAYIMQSAYNAENGNVCLFLADENGGAYYVYRMNVTPEEAAQLTDGAKIRVKGFKQIWSGEVEITDASFEMLDADAGVLPGWINAGLMSDDDLIKIMNQGILVEGAVVEPSENADGEKQPYLYKWNGSGADGDDIYFKASYLGRVWTFVVESDEFGPGSEVYEAVKALQIGDALDVYAYLYWYEGPQPHVCGIATEQYAKSSEEVMTYRQFCEAEVDAKVVVEGWIQLAAYNAGYGNASLFLHDRIGAYYVYRMPVAEEEAEKMVTGQYVQITGYKKPWSGLVEIQDVEAIAFPDDFGEYIVNAIDFGYLVDNGLAEEYMSNPISLYRASVVASTDGEGNEVGWLYKYNGTGTDGDDIYFKVRLNGEVYTVLVESDEFGPGSDVYEAAKTLEVGDVVILNGFLYWYEGPQPHITAIEKTLAKSEGVMTHAEFVAAEDEAPVVVEGFVQLVTSYNEEYGNCSVYLDDVTGAYYIYRLAVTPEEYALLKPGLFIRVSGFRGTWSGEIEVVDAVGFEVPYEGSIDSYLAKPVDIVHIPNMEAAEPYINSLICGKGAVVAASKDADGNELPFLYQWNGSGADGDDIYFNVTLYGETYTLTVETDEFPAGSEVYETVKTLQIGDVVDLEGFLYWYEGPQPHVSGITVIPQEPAEAPAETPGL